MLTIFSLYLTLVVGAELEQPAQRLFFREGPVTPELELNIPNCITNFTSADAIIDVVGFSITKAEMDACGFDPGRDFNPGCDFKRSFAVYLDVGTSAEIEMDQDVSNNIEWCIGNLTDQPNQFVYSHNSYAVVGSYETQEELDQHYNYFGRGYPDYYDSDESIMECPTSDAT